MALKFIHQTRKINHAYFTFIAFLLILNSITVLAAPDDKEQYIFERLWPTLPQPWHFERAFDIAVDQQGHVYVINGSSNQLKKFTANGHLIHENDTPLGLTSLRL